MPRHQQNKTASLNGSECSVTQSHDATNSSIGYSRDRWLRLHVYGVAASQLPYFAWCSWSDVEVPPTNLFSSKVAYKDVRETYECMRSFYLTEG